MRRSVIRAVEVLTEQWLLYDLLRSTKSDGEKLRDCVNRGEPISDHLLPGRVIMKMSDEDREALSNAKSQHFNHRLWK